MLNFPCFIRPLANLNQFMGRETVDDLILGLAHLLEMCLDLADAANVELDTL